MITRLSAASSSGAWSIEFDDEGEPTVRPDPEAIDVVGHGTACAGIIHGLAPAADLVSVRVLGPDNKGKGQIFAAGLEWAIDEGATVANLSLSSRSEAMFPIFHDLADRAYFANCLLVSAANNVQGASYPSLFAAVVSVAAHDVADPWTWFYNPAPPVEFGAYGVDVEVAWKGGGHVVATGNSFAAPHIAGLAALIRGRYPEATPVRGQDDPGRHGEPARLIRRVPARAAWSRSLVAFAPGGADRREVALDVVLVLGRPGSAHGGMAFDIGVDVGWPDPQLRRILVLVLILVGHGRVPSVAAGEPVLADAIEPTVHRRTAHGPADRRRRAVGNATAPARQAGAGNGLAWLAATWRWSASRRGASSGPGRHEVEEHRSVEGQQADRRLGGHCRAARSAGQQAQLAEGIVGAEPAQGDRRCAGLLRASHLDRAVEDHVEPVGRLALPDDRLAGRHLDRACRGPGCWPPGRPGSRRTGAGRQRAGRPPRAPDR